MKTEHKKAACPAKNYAAKNKRSILMRLLNWRKESSRERKIKTYQSRVIKIERKIKKMEAEISHYNLSINALSKDIPQQEEFDWGGEFV